MGPHTSAAQTVEEAHDDRAVHGPGEVHTPRARSISGPTALLLSVASGLAVANVYYAQPLLDVIAREFDMSQATIGLVGTFTQVGYGMGLLLVVPLGDLFDRRRLIGVQFTLSALALLTVAFAPTATALLAAMAAVGALAVVTQVLVAHAASMADPGDRGRVVGIVTSGIVIGILLARTVAGALGDLAGWRSVYLASAAAALAMAALLVRILPRRRDHREKLSYPRLIGSTFALFAQMSILRMRALLAMLIFMAMTVLLTPMVLQLSAPPLSLSTSQIGLFGLAGAAGALGAARAGRLSDLRLAQRITGVGLAVMAGSWIASAALPWSVWALVIAVIAFDFGLQSVHVANQSLIYRTRPEAQSRLTAAYMVFYSIGSAAGSITSTIVYANAGWHGVSILGAAVSTTALLFWASTRHLASDQDDHDTTRRKS
ncbi:MFS transporter [Catellatospora citrea]|uniref:MFS transporter n=1 Tax=Catellatospora citrea TaxID=53366 RepID=UPI00340F84A0